MTWDGVVSKYHDTYRRRLEISDRIQAYIQALVLRKTLESISMDFRRNGDLEGLISDEGEACLELKSVTTESKSLAGNVKV
jgi:hypothetical protein